MGVRLSKFDRKDSNKLFFRSLPALVRRKIFSYLNATDLMILSFTSKSLELFINNNLLWRDLCQKEFGLTELAKPLPEFITFRDMYLALDDAANLFNVDPCLGIQKFKQIGIIEDNPTTVAMFIKNCKQLSRDQLGVYLAHREDILLEWIQLYDFKFPYISQALRIFLSLVSIPNSGQIIRSFIRAFAYRYHECRKPPFSKDTTYLLAITTLMLRVDLECPKIRNNMSKREFIKILRSIDPTIKDKDYLVGVYDDTYMNSRMFTKYNCDILTCA
ncbi:F-box only protein 8-like [Zophobas morio]|jgi:hypothetical protein|uniref:F-box only protein 8-like n=1 Tax=Zophobas morio TaxID=2755281 RepID=UPI003082E519